jgi:hypothetical protein
MSENVLPGLVAYVFLGGFYAMLEGHAVFVMWPWIFRVGPVLSGDGPHGCASNKS